MLIPFGVFSAAGASGGGGGAGSYELISTVNGNGSSSTISLTSIPSTYKHLQIRGTLRTNKTGNVEDIYLRFNGVSGTSYAWHQLIGDGSGVYSSNEYNYNSVYLYQAPAASASSGIAYSFIADVADYASSSKYKTVKILNGLVQTSFNNVSLRSGLFKSTSAISSLELIAADGNAWSTISRVSLYGIKG